MPLSQSDIIKACEILADQEGLRVTTKRSFQGAVVVFVASVVGGLVGGPVGLGIGSTVGGMYAAIQNRGKFKSVVQVIENEMPESDKKKLAEAVNNIVSNIDASDVITLITVLDGNHTLKLAVLKLIEESVTQSMGFGLV